MKKLFMFQLLVLLIASCQVKKQSNTDEGQTDKRNTIVSIQGVDFLINGELTYKGVYWNNYKIEGLLFNSRMVQGIFDDLNHETVDAWKYPDSGKWDPDRNTNEFVTSMKDWYEQGLLSFTINLQGGSPYGYSDKQPWHNSAIDSLGYLRDEYMKRLDKILLEADRLGMVPILGIFYFGQDERIINEDALKNAVKNTINWLHDKKYYNVIIEIANEGNLNDYEHDIIKNRMHELITLAKGIEINGKRFLVGSSFSGNTIPTSNVVETSDFILIHGNGVEDPDRIIEMVETIRNLPEFKVKPILFNEDDHYNFDKPMNNMVAATSVHASWGFFDFRRKNETFEDGYQSVPVSWKIDSDRKKKFFGKVKEITGGIKVNR